MTVAQAEKSPVLHDAVDWKSNVVSWLCVPSRPGDLSELEPASTLTTGCTVAICTHKRSDLLTRLLDSLPSQQRKADELIIVDASPDDETERAVRARVDLADLAGSVLYFRVRGPLKGLTRQRNFALRWVTRDLVAFFDDDVVLRPDCLQEMEDAHRRLGEKAVGVSAFIENQVEPPSLLWRVRRLLYIIPSLRPGSYSRSGMSISWNFLAPTDDDVEGDWLSGCSMMWKTAPAREIGFNETMTGYSNGEDLDFSRRIARRGKLVLAGRARLQHLHADSGRPNAFEMGYWTLHNIYQIHRKYLPDRTWRDAAWFVYAFGMDTFVRAAALIRPGQTLQRWRFLCGRLKFFKELMCCQL